MPVYPLFLALFASLGDIGRLAARLAQALLGALAALVGFRLARSALGSRAALVAGVLLAVDPFAIFFSQLLLTEVLFTFLAVAATACFWRLITRENALSFAALAGAAVFGALALLTRPSSAGWIILLWLILRVVKPTNRYTLAQLVTCALTLVLLLLPWGMRNKAVLGSHAWLSTNGGVTLYDAQGPQADGSSNQAFLQAMPELAGLGEVERDRELFRRAVEQMRANPRRVVTLAGIKFLRTWNPAPNVSSYRDWKHVVVGGGYTIAVLILCGVGLLRERAARDRQRRERRLLHILIWTAVLYFTVVHCVYIGSVRYRVPLMPLLAIGAGAAFMHREPGARELAPQL